MSGINLTGQYSINIISAGSFSPADSTTYYLGDIPLAPTATEGNRRIYFNQAGRVIGAVLSFFQTAGTAENSTISFRLNATTDTALSTTVDNSAIFRINNTTLTPITVAVGDFFELKWATPAWVTNPTTVFITGYILVSR